MQLTFPSNKSVEMSFKVGIAGTASQPTKVGVVLERDGQELTFPASMKDDQWLAVIDNPGRLFGTGEVKLSINVLLNNRLFTPMKTLAEIIDVADAVAHVDQPAVPELEPVMSPTVMPAPTTEVPVQTTMQVAPNPAVPALLQPPVPRVSPFAYAESVSKKKKAAKAPAKIATPTVIVEAPVVKSLLKQVEPAQRKVTTKVTTEAVETKLSTQATPMFSLKKVKVIFK